MTSVAPVEQPAAVEEQAAQILRTHGLFSVPVDPVVLANRAGIKVFNAKFAESNLSGMIAKRNDHTTILVNGSEPPYRKRFTIAHELGHHFLHLLSQDGEFTDSTVDLFREEAAGGEGRTHEKEVEANRFAAALLMPAELVREQYRQGTRSAAELARLFNVSEVAMNYRLARLRLA